MGVKRKRGDNNLIRMVVEDQFRIMRVIFKNNSDSSI